MMRHAPYTRMHNYVNARNLCLCRTVLYQVRIPLVRLTCAKAVAHTLLTNLSIDFFLSKCGERNFDWFMSTAHSCNFLSTKLTHTYESYENLIGIFRDNRITMSGNGFVQNLKETGHIFT